MAGAPDIVDQIEYRWHDRREFSPFASTMPAESLRQWDSRIRTWVRHPPVEGLRESLRYQVQPGGYAALAWRFEDWPTAGRTGAMRRRTRVSRVLAGPVSLLTPETAIALCRAGLPLTAGPPPGQVTAGTELSVLKAADLSALVSGQAEGLDQEAARQEGLRQVVAAALSSPDPLAIYPGDAHILEPPGQGVQCLLLWGLRRILWPLLSTADRGWSFSTFEPPLGREDAAALPDIVFRQAAGTRPAGEATRREVESHPFDPGPPDDEDLSAQLAAWLVAEYRKRGGDELRQLITTWCGTERSPQARLRKVHDALHASHSLAVPPRIFMSYRREETGWAAGRLFDSLATHFGRDQIFKDIDSIEPGDDFVEVINTAVGSCHVLLALIGNRWLTVTDQEERRRLDDPGDFVRLEIEAALQRGIRVIPVLVDGIQMPRADQLPESLAGLARRQGLKLGQEHFGSDFQRLLPPLRRSITEAQEQARRRAERALRQRQRIEQTRKRIRERAEARDWDAVVALGRELPELGPADGDLHGLVETAIGQIARRRRTEEEEAERRLRAAAKPDLAAVAPEALAGAVPGRVISPLARDSVRPAPIRRGIGRRRGRSNDRLLWTGLACVVVVALAAIGAIVKLEFYPSGSGPAHTMVTPARIGSFVRTVDMEHQADVAELKSKVINVSSGQASQVVSAVYQSGNSGTGNTTQIIMFIGGHLVHADPVASVARFKQQFKGAMIVSAGPLGGRAACIQDGAGVNAAGMCAWFDNDSFGEMISPTMNATALGSVMHTIRSSVERPARN
jgi:hypothetical protein